MIENFSLESLRKPIIKVGVHDGQFHTDDILAISLLQEVFPQYQFQIIRTREKAILDTCDILLDVGGMYDGKKYFDHHQDMNLKCSVSLLWEALAKKYPFHFEYMNNSVLDAVSELDINIALAEEKRGPYQNYYTITSLIWDMNYLVDGGFEAALQIGRLFWRANLIKCDVLKEEIEYIERGRQEGHILWVEKGMDIKNHKQKLIGMGVRFVFHPHYNPQKWCLKSVNAKLWPIPESVDNAEFIHGSRFLGIFSNDYEAKIADSKL